MEPRSRPEGLGWNLVGSAAGHVLALACGILLMRATTARPLAGVVEVDLVGGGVAPATAERKPTFPLALRGVSAFPYREDAWKARAAEEPAKAPEGEVPPDIGGGIRNRIYETTGFSAVDDKGPAKEVPAPVPVEVPGKAGIAAAGKTVAALLPSVDGGGGGGEAGVRLLRNRIESRIVYPEEAVRKGQEGVVLLRIRIGEGGIPKEIRVARSSGARTLDEAARTGVLRAAPLPSIPGWFEVPVRFLLR